MQFIQEECSQYLRQNITLQLISYQYLSGRGINKLGRYYQCLNNNNTYYLINTTYNHNHYINGLCFNSICNNYDLQYVFNSIQNTLLFPLRINHVLSIQNYLQWDWILGVGLTITLLLILLVLISTIYTFWTKIKKNIFKDKLETLITTREQSEYSTSNASSSNACINTSTNSKSKQINRKWSQYFSIQTGLYFLIRNDSYYSRVKILSLLQTIAIIQMFIAHTIVVLNQLPIANFRNERMSVLYYLCFYGQDLWLLATSAITTYELRRRYSKNPNFKLYFAYFAYRMLSFLLIYNLFTFIAAKVVPFLGDGPIWGIGINWVNSNCSKPLWKYLLLIENFDGTMCNRWSWLWLVNFQLSLIFGLVIFLQRRFRLKRVFLYIIRVSILLLCIGSMVALVMTNDSKSVMGYYLSQQNKYIRISAVSRILAYTIGYIIGTILDNYIQDYNKKQNKFISIYSSSNTCILSEILSIIIIVVIVINIFYSEVRNYDIWEIIILQMQSLLFMIAITIMIMPALIGYNTIIRTIAESRIVLIVSKIGSILIGTQWIIQIILMYGYSNDVYITNKTYIVYVTYQIIPALIISIVIYLIFWSPFTLLIRKLANQKIIFY